MWPPCQIPTSYSNSNLLIFNCTSSGSESLSKENLHGCIYHISTYVYTWKVQHYSIFIHWRSCIHLAYTQGNFSEKRDESHANASMALFQSRIPLKASIEAHSHTCMSTAAYRSQPAGGVFQTLIQFLRGVLARQRTGGLKGRVGRESSTRCHQHRATAVNSRRLSWSAGLETCELWHSAKRHWFWVSVFKGDVTQWCDDAVAFKSSHT